MIRIGADHVTALERCIDRCQKDLEPLRSFILPGGGPVAAFLHQARTVCRRAERRLLSLLDVEPIGDGPLKYLNRLSDLLFVLARWIAHGTGSPEYLWEHGLALEKGPARPKAGTTARPAGAAKRAAGAATPPAAGRRSRRTATTPPPRVPRPRPPRPRTTAKKESSRG